MVLQPMSRARSRFRRGTAGPPDLDGRRVLITGGARGVGAALARRLHARGARVALTGLEGALLESVAGELDAPWWSCDVTDRRRGRHDHRRRGRRARWARRRGGQRGRRSPASFGGRRPVDHGANGRRQRDGHLPHAAGGGSPRGPCGRLRGGGGVSGRRGPLAAPRRVQRVEGRGRSARQHAAPRAARSGARVGVAYFAELDTDMTYPRVRHCRGTCLPRWEEPHHRHTAARGHRRARARHRTQIEDDRGAVVRRPDPSDSADRPDRRGGRDRGGVCPTCWRSLDTSGSSSPLRSRRRAGELGAGAGTVTADRARRPSRRRRGHRRCRLHQRAGHGNHGAEPLPHPRSAPAAVPRVAALRRQPHAPGPASPSRDRAGDPSRRAPTRMRL